MSKLLHQWISYKKYFFERFIDQKRKKMDFLYNSTEKYSGVNSLW